MRNLKVLGLAFVAVLAMSAFAASSASANQATFTGGPTTLGHDTEGAVNALTGAAGVECATATYPGSVSGSTLTTALEFGGCITSAGAPATVTPNGCHYTITLGTRGTPNTPATAHLDCPEGQQVVVHIYNDPAPHMQNACTIEIPGQKNLGGLTASNQSSHVRIRGTVPNITNYVTGPCVGGGTLNLGAAELHADITFTGISLH